MLWVGLGNPGASYGRSRHNAGFMALDALARSYAFAPFRTRFSGVFVQGHVEGHQVSALKPMTFMNLSGQSVGQALRFYGLSPRDVVVFHDDLDIPLGGVKIKFSGGHAGHNGVRSVISHIGADFHRVRLGIGHPGDRALVHSYVLGDFSKPERVVFEGVLENLVRCGPLCAKGEMDALQRECSVP